LGGPLVAEGGLEFSVSHTTRSPRAAEVDGRDYHFVTVAGFQEMVAAGQFLEWAEVHGNLYGTSLVEVMPRLDRGIDVLLDIDVQGAERVIACCPAHRIFVMPPSYEELAGRLALRGQDDPRTIERRLANAAAEMQRWDRYNYVIINDDADRASAALTAIILEKRFRQTAMSGRIQDILKDFQERGNPRTY
jgi:guanylate kinase